MGFIDAGIILREVPNFKKNFKLYLGVFKCVNFMLAYDDVFAGISRTRRISFDNIFNDCLARRTERNLPSAAELLSAQKKIVNLGGIIFSGIFLLSMLGCVAVGNNIYNQLAEREKIIALHKNDDLIVVPPLEIPKWSEIFLGTRTWDNMTMWWGGDLEFDAQGNRGILFAKYHGLKKKYHIRKTRINSVGAKIVLNSPKTWAVKERKFAIKNFFCYTAGEVRLQEKIFLL